MQSPALPVNQGFGWAARGPKIEVRPGLPPPGAPGPDTKGGRAKLATDALAIAADPFLLVYQFILKISSAAPGPRVYYRTQSPPFCDPFEPFVRDTIR